MKRTLKWEGRNKNEKNQLWGFVFTLPGGHVGEGEVFCCGSDLNPFPSLCSAGLLSGRNAACPHLFSWTSLLLNLLLFSFYCCRCCGFSSRLASLPQRGCSFSPSCPVRHHIRDLIFHIQSQFMLCSMLKWSVHHAETYSMYGLH